MTNGGVVIPRIVVVEGKRIVTALVGVAVASQSNVLAILPSKIRIPHPNYPLKFRG